MNRFAPELLAAVIAIVAIAAMYALLVANAVPARTDLGEAAIPPGGLVGHALGIVGFLMMLGAETLYTLRKRVKRFNYGPTSVWLQVHVFAGIVGPFLVLLHTAGKLNGLAGAVTILTIIMVLSGFVGRYIYTAAPRSLDGDEIDEAELEGRYFRIEHDLQALLAQLPEASREALTADLMPAGWIVVLARPILRWRQRRRVQAALRELTNARETKTAPIENLLTERYALLLQIHSLATTRRALALWHVFHVPLGGVLFSLAFIHVGAALHYATFMR